MSEASAQPADSKVSKRPHFVRQLSKTYEKGKEAMKRNLLTPRGPKTAKSAELPLPDTKPEAPTDSAAQVAPAPVPAVQKAVTGDAHTIKVDIKATHDATTPVELLVEPAEKGAPKAHEEPAASPPVETPATAPRAEVQAPTPQPKVEAPAPQPELKAPAPQPELKAPAPQPEEAAAPVQKEVSSVAAAASAPAEPEVQDAPEVHKLPEKPVHTEIEAPADVSCAPPAVSVTIKGAPVTAEEPKAASKAFTSEPAQEKKGRGLRRALIGLAAIAAASVAVLNARR
ncbi:g2107 [Coccomyxa viridis]|uniref:G2107 protein n=1 Tax=Coccomyxa viridis TaxID=1274662 RepID=A0ABP1FMI7_9CHLO